MKADPTTTTMPITSSTSTIHSSSSPYLYRDFSTVQDSDVPTTPKPSLRAERRRKRPKELSFPTKLHDLLTKCYHEGMTDIVAWQDHGRSFSIRDPDQFASRYVQYDVPHLKSLCIYKKYTKVVPR